MDAQNAVGSASTKPPPASLKRPGNDLDQHLKASVANRTPNDTRAPVVPKDSRLDSRASPVDEEDDTVQDGNSDAETIVLPGKDGHSPSKVRKIKNEDKSESGDLADNPSLRRQTNNPKYDRKDRDRDHERERQRSDRGDKATVAPSATEPTDGLKKRFLDRPEQPHSKDGSSGLSSAPTSPPPQRRRRPSFAQSDSDSERGRGFSSRISATEKSRFPDKVVPHKRKAPKADSDDEAESRKIRRQRMSGSGLNASRSSGNRDAKPIPSKLHNESSGVNHNHPATRNNRSTSPPVRPHRRSVSTQLPGQSGAGNGLSHKKKRVPAPLQSTEYHSDESSASGSPYPRSSKLRHLATPATAESAISPAKMPPHKKHLDAHGQTFLARACAKGDYELAKQRLQERPDDINHADYAGNTPLQIAALNGHEEIVKLLLDAGCNLDCVNNEKETPLMDAVDNDHIGVVKLLLAAGVNPRKTNACGEEPLDKVDNENEDADEMRQLLQEARERYGQRRRTSEEHHAQDHTDGMSSHGQESPRRSPGAPSAMFPHAGSRRAGTVRANKTSNHLLYMPMDDKTLRQAAARGDEETVTRILQVRDTFDDPESMVAAAKAGHDIVINLLLALGGANPDPKPTGNEEQSTPMLAAIGQEDSLNVVRLLLAQNNFDPTRRFKGETYYEIASKRRGPNCDEEERILKEAYDDYKKTHKDAAKPKSDGRREQERDRDLPRTRTDPKEGVPKAHKRKASSPARDPKKLNTSKALTNSPKEKRRSDSFSVNHDEQPSPKRGPGRPKKEDRIPTIAVSDREASPAASKQTTKPRRPDSEVAASSEGEAVKPRRKLVSRRELNGERDRQQHQLRRPSLASNASSLKEPPSSPQEIRREEPSDKQQQKAEKYHDRTKALKRDDSRDRLSVSGENTAKRHRSSATPPRLGSSDKEGSEGPLKKRRLDAEGREKRQKSSVAPEDRPHKRPSSRPPTSSSATTPKPPNQKSREEGDRKAGPPKIKKPETELGQREPVKSTVPDKSIHVKREDADVQMRDIDRSTDPPEVRTHPDKENDLGKPSTSVQQQTLQEAMRKAQERKREFDQEAIRKTEERNRKRKEEKERERRQKEEEESKQRLEEEKRQREEEEQRKRKKEEEERKAREEDERRKQQEEEERRQREEDDRRKRLEVERKKKEEEERRRQEEEARLLREEEERKKRLDEERRRQEEEERKKRQEEEQKRREEEERLRREQLEREAAEEAVRLKEKEEEERKLREEAERKHREEMERRRAAREAERLAEMHRVHLEQERVRLSKLPPVLRWLDESPNPKLAEVARKFVLMQGVRYDCIRPESTGTADGREQWVLNTQVALLLGEKDLTLSRYTAWQHIPVSDIAKQVIWRLEADRYALTSPNLYELGRQIPGYYGEDPDHMGYRVIEKLRRDAWAQFAAMDMFFVKASDLMFIVPTIPHLRSLELAVAYRELPEHESQLRTWAPLQKWRFDPDANRFHGFAPRNKYYVSGELSREDLPGFTATSSTPFPEKRVPRKGLQAVSPGDPDYHRICREQGLHHLLGEAGSPVIPNGFHSSPTSAISNNPLAHDSSGPTSPTSMHPTAGVNGTRGHRPMSPSSDPGAAKPRPLVNGINGSSHDEQV